MTETIRSFVEGMLEESPDLFLVDIIKKGIDTNPKFVIILDGDHGIGIDHCAKISRGLSHYLDETIDSSHPYILEVTSSGLDHPLLLHRQYEKNVGKNLKITLQDDSVEEGKLLSVSADSVTVEQLLDKKKKVATEKTIDFKEIKKTFVLVSFK